MTYYNIIYNIMHKSYGFPPIQEINKKDIKKIQKKKHIIIKILI